MDNTINDDILIYHYPKDVYYTTGKSWTTFEEAHEWMAQHATGGFSEQAVMEPNENGEGASLNERTHWYCITENHDISVDAMTKLSLTPEGEIKLADLIRRREEQANNNPVTPGATGAV